jgi:hypothetical protein
MCCVFGAGGFFPAGRAARLRLEGRRSVAHRTGIIPASDLQHALREQCTTAERARSGGRAARLELYREIAHPAPSSPRYCAISPPRPPNRQPELPMQSRAWATSASHRPGNLPRKPTPQAGAQRLQPLTVEIPAVEHEVDIDTWSRSLVATLGLGIVGASHSARMKHADGATPNSSTTRRFEAKLPSKRGAKTKWGAPVPVRATSRQAWHILARAAVN